MDNNELNLRLSFAFSKCRNIIYYMTIEDRERATYIHVVRDLRKTFVELQRYLPPEDSNYEKVSKIISMINPKVKKEECYDTMMSINELFKFV